MQHQLTDSAPHGGPPVTLQIPLRRLMTGLITVVVALSAAGTLANICIYQIAPTPDHKLARIMTRLDLGHEPSIPAWYSSLALLACAVLLGLIATAHVQTGRGGARPWTALAVIFALLALDEAVMFHELLHNTMRQLLQLKGVFYFSWVIPGMVFVALFVAAFARFLWALEPLTRYRMIAAGALFVGGAIGMEMAAGVVVEQHGVASIRHTAVQTVEETLEMLGVLLFMYALLDYLRRHFGSLRITVSETPTESGRGQPEPEFAIPTAGASLVNVNDD